MTETGNQSSSATGASTKKRASKVKPDGYQELETLVKEIFEGQGQSYFEWLHGQHQELVLAFNLSNKSKIASLAAKEAK